MIKNLKDLAEYLGLDRKPTIEAISRAVYKATTCGASVSAVPAGVEKVGERTITVRALGTRSIRGIVWTKIVSNGYKMPNKYKESVLKFMQAKETSAGVIWSGVSVRKIVDRAVAHPKDTDNCKVRKVDQLRRLVSFNLVVPVMEKHTGGVLVGSIVEGVDECTAAYRLMYPFSAKKFETAVADVELEAKGIWQDTHGCPKCGPEDTMTGYTPINPKCKACKGRGIIL